MNASELMAATVSPGGANEARRTVVAAITASRTRLSRFRSSRGSPDEPRDEAECCLGRGIGIINKLKAYELQDQGLNTIDANLHLGLQVDARQYNIAIDMLHDLGIRQIHLLTNNPDKIEAIEHSDIEVVSRLPIVAPPHEENAGYLKTKQEEMGHLFKLF